MALNPPVATLSNSSSIFESNDALKTYLQEVRQRREHRKFTRAERERLQDAIALVNTELDAAKQDADAEITLELDAVLQQFTQRLLLVEELPHTFAVVHSPAADAVTFKHTITEPPPAPLPDSSQHTNLLSSTSSPFDISPVIEETRSELLLPKPETLQNIVLPETSRKELFVEADQSAAKEQFTNSQTEAVPAADAIVTIETIAVVAPVVPPTSEPVPLSEEERSARLAILNAELDAIEARWQEIDRESLRRFEGGLHRPRCLQTRALACELGRLNTAAHQQGVGKELRGAITRIRERMEQARAYAGDNAPCLPFESTYWSNVVAQLSEEDWAELASLYTAAADAQTAYEWYMEHKDALEGGTRWTLLNAIAAVQQRLFCVLEEFDSKDRLQTDLYLNLRAAADSEGYLTAMNPDMAWNERETIAAQLPSLLQNAQRAYVANIERKAKEARKSAAITSVLEWCAQRKTQALSKYTLDKQKLELAHLLDECLASGVPPTHLQVRSALLDIGPLLLENLAKYRKFLDAILTERKRKGLDAPDKDATETGEAGEEDEPADSQMESYRQYVSLFTEGQKVLILGGVPRQRVCEELEQQIACVEVKWPDSKKSDRAAKFQGDIKRADILIVVKNYASHEMTEKGREWTRAQGKPFILLPSGYGVNQIIHQLYNYATMRDSSSDAPALIAASNPPTFQLT